MAWSEEAPIRLKEALPGKFSLYLPDFFLKEQKPWLSYASSAKVSREELVSLLSEFCKDVDEPLRFDWREPDYELFCQTFVQLKGLFELGQLRKAVPVVFEKSRFKASLGAKAKFLIRLLRSTQGWPLYLYGNWNLEEGILGASPEFLFKKMSENQFEVPALAGTQSNQGYERVPLLEDPKERDEHQIVIEGICASLEPWGQVQIGQTQVLALPTLSHLYTPLVLTTENQNESLSDIKIFEGLIASLHPTPALGAFPKKKGWEWLLQYEEIVKRHRLGSPFGGWQDSKNAQNFKGAQVDDEEVICLVGIRNIQWRGEEIFIGAGCGIVATSELDREWNELHTKIQSVKALFGIEADR